jgi:dTDP-4-amino-4,6-dideoxygalactose transaminase
VSASPEAKPVIGNLIPFNVPAQVGNELAYVRDSFASGHLSGNGRYTRLCEQFFERRFGFKKALMTTSCTDALEMAAILIDIQPGDEVIVPSYTFVSSANAFVLRGAKIIFTDSEDRTPNIDATQLEALITVRTKAIVIVHYAGMACDMEAITAITQQHGLFLIEDAAHAIDASYRGQPLGSFGHLATFSFHETKNVICGEGGMLVINDERFIRRAEIIRDKGTDRQAFFRGEVDKYTWQDVGSSFLPPDYVAAYLWAQLECLDQIQDTRLAIWQEYHRRLQPLAQSEVIQLPALPPGASNNAHMYYLVCKTLEDRDTLIAALKAAGINPAFHYLPLHSSPFYAAQHDGRPLENATRYALGLLRLPLYYNLKQEQVTRIADTVLDAVRRLPSRHHSS